MEKNFLLDSYSMSRFMHNYSLNSIESWDSPSAKILINDIPFSVLPFNFNSVDLLPMDLLQTGEIDLTYPPGIQSGSISSVSSINVKRKEIPDSLLIGFRGYFGSETGDPLIHTFTRPDIPSVNINKIPLSGSFSLSSGNQDFRYRFLLGYFGHFNSSSVNDQIMNFRNPRFYNKLDKQVIVSGELEFYLPDNKKISFNSSFSSCYGWDIPPFIGSVIHFESYIYSIRTQFENIFPGVSFALKSDGSLNEINGMTGIPPSKFFLAENSFISRWNLFRTGKLKVSLVPEINLLSTKNLRIAGVPMQQNFFKEEFDKIGYAVSGLTEYEFDEFISCNLNLRMEKHFSGNSGFSINSSITKEIGKISLTLSAGSEARFPSVSDLYGKFVIYENAGTDTESYIIEGNNLLNQERLNYMGFLGKALFEKIFISAEFFFQQLEKPIIQKNLKIKRTSYPGDIVRSAIYNNDGTKNNYGLKISSKYRISESLQSGFSYIYIENSESKFFPRHKISASLEYSIISKGSLILSWIYRSSSTADEFILDKEEDEYRHTGFDGKNPGYSSLNFSIVQGLAPFYFINDLALKISIENLLDRKIKFIPIGNETGRTFIFYISGRI
ncbi:MAG TPA: hypothetical protein VMT35_17180 [Ignavibacteriaceae bacterium]|nr:hypothetical protein [Ignavibacteriaceae bacterium]